MLRLLIAGAVTILRHTHVASRVYFKVLLLVVGHFEVKVQVVASSCMKLRSWARCRKHRQAAIHPQLPNRHFQILICIFNLGGDISVIFLEDRRVVVLTSKICFKDQYQCLLDPLLPWPLHIEATTEISLVEKYWLTWGFIL